MAQLRDRVPRPDCRLLTLTGPPGVGKTRLALELAAALNAVFPDGAWFVSLASLSDSGLVAASIAKVLGLREEGFGALEPKLHGYLREKRLLLLLDNFEHLRDATGTVAELLRAAPDIHVLVTSRVALRLSGESEYPVPPLELPRLTPLPSVTTLGTNPAVALFVARARAVRPDWSLDAESATPIAQLCHRLEGIPLAIELAAARSKLFSPRALLARLDQRFAVLKGGARDLPVRQQSLQAALDWSYELLTPEQRRLLRRAAVFARSFTLEAAAAVCDADHTVGIDVADGLEALLDQSLLQSTTAANGDTRFSMLDTIREYALARLHREEAQTAMPQVLRRQHALYFVQLAEAAEPSLRGAKQAEGLRQLEAEHDNLRAALAWCVESREGELGWSLAGALWEFWLVHGHLSEARKWLEAVLAIPGTAGPAKAKALCGAGVMARFQGDFVAARSRLAESETLWRVTGNAWGLANALTYLGTTERYVGDPQSGRTHLDESLILWRRLGDRWGLALALSARAGLANDEGDYHRARAFREESLQLYRATGDHEGEARALIGLGEVARCQGGRPARQGVLRAGPGAVSRPGKPAPRRRHASELGPRAQSLGRSAGGPEPFPRERGVVPRPGAQGRGCRVSGRSCRAPAGAGTTANGRPFAGRRRSHRGGARHHARRRGPSRMGTIPDQRGAGPGSAGLCRRPRRRRRVKRGSGPRRDHPSRSRRSRPAGCGDCRRVRAPARDWRRVAHLSRVSRPPAARGGLELCGDRSAALHQPPNRGRTPPLHLHQTERAVTPRGRTARQPRAPLLAERYSPALQSDALGL